MPDDSPTNETVLSEKHTSHWIYARSHAASVILVLGLVYLLIKHADNFVHAWQKWALITLIFTRGLFTLYYFLKCKSEKTTLTDQRLRLKSGILSIESSDIELYRIKDIFLRQNPLHRLFGLGDLRIMTTDKSNPEVHLLCLTEAEKFREVLRNQVEIVRDKKRVREVDMNLESADASPDQV
ncbi:MAG: hypothetical protein RL095_3034 [Verrucomicrobiota bacterium]|jgi:membrane protein YdbS with pleckstrin-like domain